ncbi:MAG: hypothetical protein WAP35_02955 [Solirubrobacterales bacterium]
MSPLGRPTLEEVIAASAARAEHGEKVHPGFDFASIAPSPLKQRDAEAQAAAGEIVVRDTRDTADPVASDPVASDPVASDHRVPRSVRDAMPADEITAYDARAGAISADDIADRLGAARERLRRATANLDRAE